MFENIHNNTNNSEKIARVGQFSISGIQFGLTLTEIANYTGKLAPNSGEIACFALRAVSISFFFIGSGIGIGTGYYITYKHCKELIEKLYIYFKENIATLSDSIQQAVKYLELQCKYYLEKNQ